MSDRMTFPDTVEEFMDTYKVVDRAGYYMSKGSELVPVFRMKQWFEHSSPVSNWIPVTERLPEEEVNVLVTVHFLGLQQTHRTGWNDHIKPSYYVDVAQYIGGEWISNSDEYKVARSRHIVTAWLPLPEPYMEEES